MGSRHQGSSRQAQQGPPRLVSGADAFGIDLASRGSSGSLDAKVVGNTVFDVQDDGVRIRAGNGTLNESDTVRVYLEGNDATTCLRKL